MDQPLSEGDKIFIAGSSRCIQGKRCLGYAVVDGTSMTVIFKERLPSYWSAQCCELCALKKGLEYLAHKKGTIYTDSQVCLWCSPHVWKNLGRTRVVEFEREKLGA